MISEVARKNITMSSLAYLILIFVISFVNAFTSASGSILDWIAITVLDLSLVWLGYGFWLFAKDEQSKSLKHASLILLSCSVLNLVGASLGLAYSYNLVLYDWFYYLGGAIQIVTFTGFAIAFFIIRNVMNGFVITNRNVFGGQTSLPIGFFFYTIYAILVTIKNPADLIYVDEGGNLAFVEGSETFLMAVYFMQIIFTLMVIIGFWNLRRAITILDKVPKEIFEILRARKAATQSPLYPPLYSSNQEITKLDTSLPPTHLTSQEPATNVGSDEIQKNKKQFCIKCGLELDHDAEYCSNCGAKNPYK